MKPCANFSAGPQQTQDILAAIAATDTLQSSGLINTGPSANELPSTLSRGAAVYLETHPFVHF